MKTKNIEHKVLIGAPPAEVYDALLNGKKHAQFTGSPARISAKRGASFSCHGDYIIGFNLQLERAKLIVQAWRSRNWPVETWSIVKFKLLEKPGGKTEIQFTHTGVPADDYEEKDKGWRTHYWEPLKKFLEK